MHHSRPEGVSLFTRLGNKVRRDHYSDAQHLTFPWHGHGTAARHGALMSLLYHESLRHCRHGKALKAHGSGMAMSRQPPCPAWWQCHGTYHGTRHSRSKTHCCHGRRVRVRASRLGEPKNSDGSPMPMLTFHAAMGHFHDNFMIFFMARHDTRCHKNP